MKKINVKQILSVFLAIILIALSMPVVFADDETVYHVGDHIEYGTYPQSSVSDALIIEKLNAKEKNWISYNYYKSADDPAHGNMETDDYMKYADITYKGNKYRAVTFSDYRINSDQSNSSFKKDQVYYFKFEPLSWRVLDPNTGLIMCEQLIDAQPFQDSYYYDGSTYWLDETKDSYINNYAESSIRVWLNDTFYETAFTEEQQENIDEKLIDNSAFSEQYAAYNSVKTTDSVFLLSYNELTDSNYGFSAAYNYVSNRQAKGTPYALCQGLWRCTISGPSSWNNSYWITRTSGSSNSAICYVSGFVYSDNVNTQEPGGRIYTSGSPLSVSRAGIRPACYLHELKNDTEIQGLDIYNLGEETYSFENFHGKYTDQFGLIHASQCYDPNCTEGGHCFGMSATSSMYYLGLLNKTIIGGNNEQDLFVFKATDKVKAPICHYQKIQGSYSKKAIVAGGTYYKKNFLSILFGNLTGHMFGSEYNIESDWNEVISYVNDHSFDNSGSLQIGLRKKDEGGHSINFLRYDVVDGQERIYAYDNNFPDRETYFYKDEDEDIVQAPKATFYGAIDCIALRDVSKYFKVAKEFDQTKVIYSKEGSIIVSGTEVYPMDGEGQGLHLMYEIPREAEEVRIIPKEDNASFVYMDQEYSFDKIDEDTYGILKLSTTNEVEMNDAELIIENAPEVVHTHTYTATVTTPATCTEPGVMTYTCVDGDDTYTETIPATGHVDDNNDGHCDACGEQMTGGDHCKFCGKIHNGGFFDKLTGFFHKIFAIFKR